jgi:putative ABC transport system permease protein
MILLKFFPLLLANLGRKKTRSALTMGSFAVALFLFSLLATIDSSFNQGVEVAGADRLVVMNKTSLIQPLPLSYVDRIRRTKGVTDVTHAIWFGGLYINEKNFFPQLVIDHKSYLQMYREFVVSPEHWRAFCADREGAIVGRRLLQRFGWKIGDRIPLQGAIFSGTWEFNIRGTYRGTRPEDDENQFWFRYDYLDERRELAKGTVGWYMVRVENPDNAAAVAADIESQFANSAAEVKAQSEKVFATGFAQQIGNIQGIMISVGTIVFFTLLLVTGSTMAMSVRERTGELAVLKTLGFTDRAVMCLVLAESLLYALAGGLIGIALAKLYTLGGDPTGGFLPSFYLAPVKMAYGMVFALLAGLASGWIPAMLAMRLKIVEALRRI